MTTERVIVRRILVAAAALGAVCALGAFMLGGVPAALGSVLGTALGAGNLWALGELITRLIDTNASKSSKGPAAVFYLAKALGFFLVAGFLFSRPWMHHEGFMAGFTALVVAIVVGGLWGGFEDDPTDKSE